MSCGAVSVCIISTKGVLLCSSRCLMELDIAFAARGFLSCATVKSTIIGEIASA